MQYTCVFNMYIYIAHVYLTYMHIALYINIEHVYLTCTCISYITHVNLTCILTLYMCIEADVFLVVSKKENFLLVDKALIFFDLNLIQDIQKGIV